MASLFNTKISDTYPGLIKTLDNAAISASLKELTDGSGNQSGLFINTAGDFKASGILEFGSLKDTGENITITKFVDEADGIANNDNDTTIPTSAAVVDYVASKITLEDLDFSGDSGNGSVDLDSQTFAIVGTSNEIETTASNQQLQIGLPSSISVNLVGNVTGNLTGNTTGTVTATSVLADGVTATTQSSNDNSTKVATTAYVDAQVTLEDLDFAGNSGTGSVDLDSNIFNIVGTTNQVTTSATNQTLNISLPATVHRNLQGDVTGDLTGNVTASSVLADGVTATTQSQGDNSTKIATTAYVDAGLSDQDTLAEVLAVGNTTGGTNIAVSANDDITFTDTSKAIFGDGSDLQIYHEGSDSYIKDAGTGNLNINADQLVFKSSSNTETKAVFNTNGAVELYHDDSKKLETVSNGVDITGNADVSGQITVGTNNTLLAESALRFKSSGNSFIDQGTVGQSLYIRTSNAAVVDTNAVIIASDGDIDLSGSLTIAQDLTVNGTTTTVNTQTLAVEDPLISLAKDNAANSVDIGFYGRYNDGSNRYLGLYADASDTNTFKLFKGTTTEPTTTVDSTATGYALADLDVNILDSVQVYASNMIVNDYIYHNGDLNTYFGFSNNDNILFATGGSASLNLDSSQNAAFYGNITTTGNVTLGAGLSVTGGASNSVLTLGCNTGNWVFTNVQSSRNLEISDSDGTGVAMTIDTSANTTFAGDVTAATYYKSSGTSAVLGTNASGEVLLRPTAWNLSTAQSSFTTTLATIGTDATFAGGITTTSATGIKIDTTGNAILELDGASGSTEAIIFRHSGTEVSRIAHSNSTNLVFSTGSSVTTALTLDSSQNATFAGNVNTGRLFVEQSGADIIDMTRTGVGTYRFAISGSDAFSLFDVGANADRLIIDSSGNVQLQTVGAQLRFQNSAGAAPYIKNSGEDASTAPYGQNLEFYTGGSKRLTIDSSGNVGIGETNPENDNRLHIKYSDANITPLSSSPLVVERNDVCLIQTLTSNASDAGILFGDGDDNDIGGLFYLHGSDTMTFRTNTSEKMRITSDGTASIGNVNPGSGVQLTVRRPNDLGNNVGNYQTLAAFQNSVSNFNQLIINSVRDANGTDYTTAGMRLSMLVDSTWMGYMQFNGSGNNAGISFGTGSTTSAPGSVTERMRIDSSGNVGINETDPSGYWGQANNIVIDTSGNGGITIKSTSAGNGRLVFTDTKSTTAGNTDGGMIHYDHTNDSMHLHANGSERIQIDSIGRMGFNSGSIETDTRHYFRSNNNTGAATGVAVNVKIKSTQYAGTHVQFVGSQGNGGTIGYNNLTASYNTTGSDERLKKNITNWNENILDKFKDIKPKEFHFNQQEDSEEKQKGYIAQNEVDKFPEAYPLLYDDVSKEDRHQFNPSGMVVYLMKAIQELKAEIDELKRK